ncbi:MAG: hypothetical protein Q9166_007655 [cf. Caloplaca sp. 2 TL-2023]
MSSSDLDTDAVASSWQGPATETRNRKVKKVKAMANPIEQKKRPKGKPTYWDASSEHLETTGRIRGMLQYNHIDAGKTSSEKLGNLDAAVTKLQVDFQSFTAALKDRPHKFHTGMQTSKDDIQSIVTQYLEAVQELIAEIKSDSRSIQHLREKNLELQKKINSLSTAHQDGRRERRRLSDDVRRLQEQLKMNEEKTGRLSQEKASLEREKQEMIEDNNRAIGDALELREEIDASKKQSEDIREERDALEKAKVLLVNNNRTLRSSEKMHTVKIRNLTEERDKYQNFVNAHEHRFDDLQKKYNDLKADGSRLRSQRQENKAAYDSLIAEAKKLSNSKAELEKRCTYLENLLTSSHGSEEELANKTSILEKKVRDLEIRLKEGDANAREATKKIETLTGANEDLTKEVLKLEITRNSLYNVNRDLNQELEDMERDSTEASRRESELQEEIKNCRLKHKEALRLAKNHGDTAEATSREEINRLTQALHALRSSLNNNIRMSGQTESRLRQDITKSDSQCEAALKLARHHENEAAAAKKEGNDLKQDLQALRISQKESKTAQLHKDSQLRVNFQKLNSRRKEALAHADACEKSKKMVSQQNEAFKQEIETLQARLSKTLAEADRTESQHQHDIEECHIANQTLKSEKQELEHKLEQSVSADALSKEKITRLEAQIVEEKKSTLLEMRSLLDITLEYPSATLERLSIPQDVVLPPRIMPYEGCLDADSIIDEQQLSAFSPPESRIDATSVIREADRWEQFRRTCCLHIIGVVLCIDQIGATRTCVRSLWAIWGNLETGTISREQISQVAGPLASMVARVMDWFTRKTLPGIVFWLAAQIASHLFTWGYTELYIPIPDLRGYSTFTQDMLVTAGLHLMLWNAQHGHAGLGSRISLLGRFTPAVERFPNVCLRFPAELNHEKVEACMWHLPAANEALWALEFTNGNLLMWHGRSSSCVIIEYGIARFLRLTRCPSKETLWVCLKGDVGIILIDNFGKATLRPYEKDLVDNMVRKYYKVRC